MKEDTAGGKTGFIPGTNIEMIEEPIIVNSAVIMPYKYAVGDFNSKFFIELRDNKKLLGINCPACQKVYMPPRSTCGTCFAKLDEWIQVSDKGTLVSYSVVHDASPAVNRRPPFIYGLIRLDGADTNLVHFIDQADINELAAGMRVEAVFKDERNGNILDIDHFRPVK